MKTDPNCTSGSSPTKVSDSGAVIQTGRGLEDAKRRILEAFEKVHHNLAIELTAPPAKPTTIDLSCVVESNITVTEEKPLPPLEERAEQHVKSAMLRVPARRINPRQVRYYVNGDAKEDADTLIRQALRRL